MIYVIVALSFTMTSRIEALFSVCVGGGGAGKDYWTVMQPQRGEGLARKGWYFFTTLNLVKQVKLFGWLSDAKDSPIAMTRTLWSRQRTRSSHGWAGQLPLLRSGSGAVHVHNL